eukprot:TRINITY_DN10256_c0_g1_i1.p1 TRINITY_DN10256_c0_g1~~TRINITY_DN10256_c0_g1_i1.p1  ORF type:complete len:100 (+),score=31.18 TRINITY_DN10256_c0_g1_i1:298-597(+)
MDVSFWANESFSFIRSNQPYSFPDPQRTNSTVANVGPKYQQKSIETVKLRLMQGGIRLGVLINKIMNPKNETTDDAFFSDFFKSFDIFESQDPNAIKIN